MQLSSLKYLFSAYAVFSASFVSAHSPSDLDANHITFSYWNEASPPFAFETRDTLAGGIIKDIGDAISQRLKLSPHYLKMPVPRIEQYLADGYLDVDCVTSRVWKKSPDNYYWSPTLFSGADRLLIRKDSGFDIKDFKDLEGKRLGVYNGYVYHPTIMSMIDSGKIKTVKVNNIDKGMLLLNLKRVDALIDFGVILRYQMKTADAKQELALATLLADEYELSCAYSKKSAITKENLDKVIADMVEEGDIAEILYRYR